jgi:hypothetical protein
MTPPGREPCFGESTEPDLTSRSVAAEAVIQPTAKEGRLAEIGNAPKVENER